MVEKRGWPGHKDDKNSYHRNNKQARKSYNQSHPSQPRDIFDTYTAGQKLHEQKHQQLDSNDNHSRVNAPVLDRVALFTQLSYELEHDPAFAKEFSELAGDQTASAALKLAKQVNSEKTLLSAIASRRPRVPHDLVESPGVPTLVAWFDQYPDHLPALPPIQDPGLEAQVFTSSGAHHLIGNNITNSYERMEWLGDAYLELITRRIIFHAFKDTSEALPATITQDFVRNDNLARFALAYGFDERLRLGNKHMATSNDSARRTMTKIYGDVFEAYVAGVVESDPTNGYQTAHHWISALIKPTLLKYKQVVPVNPMAKEDLAKKILGKGIKINWVEDGKPTEVKGGRLYYYSVYISGWGRERQHLGSGQGPGKQQAQLLAAMEALTNPTTAVICAIKKEYDALVKIEREKAAGPDPQVIAALDKKYKQMPVS